MDPLSIAASVGSLTTGCVVTVKKLADLGSKFNNASQNFTALASEVKLVRTSLSQLQDVLFDESNTLLSQAVLKPDIREALDISFTGCQTTLSCLDKEIRSFVAKIEAGDQNLSFTDRAKLVWKDDRFKDLQQQLRGQHNAMAIVHQGLGMWVLFPANPSCLISGLRIIS